MDKNKITTFIQSARQSGQSDQQITDFLKTKGVDLATGAGIDTRSKYDIAMGKENPNATTPPEKGIISQATDQAIEGFKKVQEGVKDPSVIKGAGKIAQGALGEAAAGVRVAFSPFEAATKIASQLPIIKQGVNATNDHLIKPLADWIGSSTKLQEFMQNNPHADEIVSNLLSVGGAIAGGKFAPEIEGATEDAIATAKPLIDQTKTAITDTASQAKDAILNKAGAVKERIAPTPTTEDLTGKVLQGKTKDIQSGQRGLGLIDNPENIKTYKDLNTSATTKIGELAKQQDEIFAKDPTPHPISEFTQKVGKGKTAVKINYVENAIANLKELYSKTSDVQGLSDIQAIEAKANKTGLSTQEVNNLARTYGSEFGSKAFGKTGEALTSVNATKFENIRTGLKNTARGLLKDPASQALDKNISDLYTVKDLSGKMSEKVNTLTQRLQQPNVLQKVGGIIGKGLKITGVGDLASKLLGMDKLAGASTLSPVDLEAQLTKNLTKIQNALGKDDAGFVKDISTLIKEQDKPVTKAISKSKSTAKKK